MTSGRGNAYAIAFVLSMLTAPIAQAQSTATVAGPSPGQVSISPSGAANYRIPIQVPPGIAGMEPKLELVYDSQGGNSLLGMGWSLSGLSTITRCPRTLATDGVRGSVSLDNNDRYCMDGQRLVLVSGTEGAAGAEYRTERDSFSKILAYGNAGNGPAYFIAKTKTGLTIEYGNTSDSRVEAVKAAGATASWPVGTVRLWAQNRVLDTSGNYLTTSYTKDSINGDAYPQRVDYTGNATTGQQPYQSVQFIYEARQDISPQYQAGAMVKSVVRLKTVQTYIGSLLSREYRNFYQTITASSRTRLASVQECAMPSDQCRPATVFGWVPPPDATLQYTQNPSITSTYFAHSNHTYGSFEGDFNGDGKSDLFRWSSDPAQNVLYLSNGDGTFQAIQNSSITSSNFAHPNGTYGSFVADFNGDGKSDLFRWSSDQAQNVLHLSRGDGTFQAIQNASITGAYFSHPNGTYGSFVGDFNGDGKSDLFRWSSDLAQNVLYLSNGDGTFQVAQNSSITSAYFAHPNGTYGSFVADFNGDGKSDLLRWSSDMAQNALYLSNGDGTFQMVQNGSITGAHFAHPNGTYGSFVADLNGDGRADLLRWSSDIAQNVLYMSNGDGSFRAIQNSSITGANFAHPNGSYGSYVIDINGDGRSDLFRWSSDPAQNIVFLSNGDGTFQSIQNSSITGTQFSHPNGTFGSFVGDFDGDGKSDLLRWSTVSAYNSLYWNAQRGASDVTQTINDGSGVVTGFDYRPLTNSLTYVKDGSPTAAVYPTVDLQIPLYVVSLIQRSNGVGGVNSVQYTYGGLKAEQGTGRNILGFRWTKAKELATGIESYSEFRQDFPYTGLPVKTETRLVGAGSGGVLKRITNIMTCKNPQTTAACTLEPGSRYFPYVHSSLEESWDLNGAAYPSVTSSYVYGPDQTDGKVYGDPAQITVTTSDGAGKITINEYWPANTGAGNWILGRLKRATVISFKP